MISECKEIGQIRITKNHHCLREIQKIVTNLNYHIYMRIDMQLLKKVFTISFSRLLHYQKIVLVATNTRNRNLFE